MRLPTRRIAPVMPDGQTMDMGGDHDGHGDSADAPASRPLAEVLGVFGLVNGGVLLSAGVLRRRARRRPATR